MKYYIAAAVSVITIVVVLTIVYFVKDDPLCVKTYQQGVGKCMPVKGATGFSNYKCPNMHYQCATPNSDGPPTYGCKEFKWECQPGAP